MSLECGNAACRKTLTPPLLQCAKCKAAAYCSKECKVPPPPKSRKKTTDADARALGQC